MSDAAGNARAAALAPPRAYSWSLEAAVLRASPADFVVEEDLGFPPAGEGQHLLLRVRKSDANTVWVARELARAAGCRPFEVGYAGLKDRRAVAVQWFSVPRTATDWRALRGQGFEVLEAHAHRRKLPRGALAGNLFTVRVRPQHGDGAGLVSRLAAPLAEIARRGVPNYFGPQRFGRAGANLAHCAEPFTALPPGQRGFVLSAARAAVFNAVLAERVTAGSWGQLLPGDLAILDGRGSVFPVSEPDAELSVRCQRLEVHPSGPMWGAGEPPSAGPVHALESRVAGLLGAEAALCSKAGMRQERRSLRLAVRELSCDAEAGAAVLRFRLARGCFATAVLRELVVADLSPED